MRVNVQHVVNSILKYWLFLCMAAFKPNSNYLFFNSGLGGEGLELLAGIIVPCYSALGIPISFYPCDPRTRNEENWYHQDRK